MALGQLGTVRTVDQGDVTKAWKIPPRRCVDLRLTERVVQMVVAPNDVGYAHVVIIDAHGQHVSR